MFHANRFYPSNFQRICGRVCLIAASVALASYASADPVSPNDSYTLFVGASQSQAAFYTNLGNRLTDTSTIQVSRLVMAAISPAATNAGGANFSPTETGTLFQFLKTLESGYQVFVMPDAETLNPPLWTNWAASSAGAATGPCGFKSASPDIPYPTLHSKTDVTAPIAQELMMTVCWATLMNQNLGAPVINGLVYDGQSNVMPTTAENLSWFKQELNYYHKSDTNVPALLGWAHEGITPNVDISFAEMYDLNKGSAKSVRYSEIAPESAYKAFDSTEETICNSEPQNGVCDTSQTAVFPGLQYQENVQNPNNGKWGLSGAEGASIASCALNPNDAACNTYRANIDTTKTVYDQILQSYLYIYKWTSTWSPQSNQDFTQLAQILGPIPTPDPATGITNPQVVYLFSTQYYGPDQATAPAPNNCILNELDPKAACGIENGFGAWNQASGLKSFKNLTHQFLSYVQGCSTHEASCQFSGNAGIYMYDFIPVAWYSSQS